MIKFSLNTSFLEKRIKKIERKTKIEGNKYLRKVSHSILKPEIERQTPVDTGKAKRNWRVRKIGDNSRIIENNAMTGSKTGRVNYLIFVNNGTKYIKARRFLENSIKKTTKLIEKQKEKLLRSILK